MTFPTLVDKEDKEFFRNEIFKIYSQDALIKMLECQGGLRNPGILGCYSPGNLKEQYKNNQKAAVYVVSDYFSENYKPSKTS